MEEQKHEMIYEFDDFRLIPSESLLLRDGDPVPMTPKSFATLVHLVERRGHLVEKSELIERIWENSFVEEAAVSRCIWSIRSALGEDSKSQKYIQTVPKRGYRFVAELKEKAATATDWPPEPTPEAAPGGPTSITVNNGTETVGDLADNSNRKRTVIAVASLALLLAVLFGTGYLLYPRKNPLLKGKKQFAVLPLKPIDVANRNENYEVGIADALINRLNSINGFIARPLNATRKYSEIDQDPIDVGREQQVDYVIPLNYQVADGRMRVTAQLINVANGQIEDQYKSESDATKLFELEDMIAASVGDQITKRFAVPSGGPAAKRGTTSEEAYWLYLQGSYLNDRRDGTKAAALFDQAIALDSNYAAAWAGKALAHFTIAGVGRSGNIQEEHQRSSDAIDKALALDSNLPEAHVALCQNKFLYDYDLDSAERECKRALDLDPNSSMAHEVNARYLMERGRFDDAISEIKTSIDLEPTCLYCQRNYGMILVYARRYKEAVVQLNRLVTMDKNYGWTYQWLSLAHEMLGHESDAVEFWAKILDQLDPEAAKQYRDAYQTNGWSGFVHERIARFDHGQQAYYAGATYNAMAGDKDKAFEYLERSLQRREVWLAGLRVDPRLDALRDDPRFDQFVKRVGLR